ncbi:MAG: GNAT family N-acetyltransferase, partial [Acidobacteria bacterium ACB2]|nr:GNAT family N-acetyltransferase [Acidobacteria bacterium ACB2]
EPDLQYLTEVDGVDHVAIGAAALDEIGRYRPVGIARFVRLEERPDVAEPAVVVVDPWQGKGAGRILLERLVAAARQRGIRVFRSEVLVGNDPMLAIFEGIGPLRLEPAGDEGVVVCEVEIGEGAPGADGAVPAILHELFGLVARGLLGVRRALDGILRGRSPKGLEGR